MQSSLEKKDVVQKYLSTVVAGWMPELSPQHNWRGLDLDNKDCFHCLDTKSSTLHNDLVNYHNDQARNNGIYILNMMAIMHNLNSFKTSPRRFSFTMLKIKRATFKILI